MLAITKRLLVGRPLRSARLGETLLPKRLALPVFCSDPLSSNAYATEEILRALSLGGLALLFLTPWVALAVVVLLAVVVVSYRQTCYAYPNGEGRTRSAGRTLDATPLSLRRVPCSSTMCSLSRYRWPLGLMRSRQRS